MPFPICAEADAAPLEELRRLEFTHVRITQRWVEDETREGWLTLSHHEALLSRAEELGLGVILRVELGRVPVWMFEKYPDVHLAGADGGVCMHHPGVMSDTLYFVRTLVRSLAKYACITHWELSGGGHDACACEYVLTAYREYLQSAFAGIKEYNDACATRYLDFDGVSVISEAEVARFDAFRHVYAPAARLAETAHAVTECDTKQRPVLYLTPSITPEGALHTYDDAFPANGAPDACAGRLAEACAMLMHMDIKRCAMPAHTPLIVEIASPRGALDLHAPSARDVRRSIAAALMGGATGLIMTDRPSRDALNAAGELGATLGGFGETLEDHGGVVTRAALIDPRDAGGYGAYALRACHALLTAHGVPVDVVKTPDGAHGVIFCPACRAPDWAALEDAFKRGCNIWMEAHPALLFDERLRAFFGVKAGVPRAVEEPAPARMLPRPTFVEDRLPPAALRGLGPLAGHELRASLYLAGLEPLEGTRALFDFEGGAAVTLREAHKGKALLFATYGAVCHTAHGDARSDAALSALLGLMGLGGDKPRVIARVREHNGKRCVIAINPSAEAADVTLPSGGDMRVEAFNAAVG